MKSNDVAGICHSDSKCNAGFLNASCWHSPGWRLMEHWPLLRAQAWFDDLWWSNTSDSWRWGTATAALAVLLLLRITRAASVGEPRNLHLRNYEENNECTSLLPVRVSQDTDYFTTSHCDLHHNRQNYQCRQSISHATTEVHSIYHLKRTTRISQQKVISTTLPWTPEKRFHPRPVNWYMGKVPG